MVWTHLQNGQELTSKNSADMDRGREEKKRQAQNNMKMDHGKELKAARLTWGTAAKKGQDRGIWRSLVRALCATRHEEDNNPEVNKQDLFIPDAVNKQDLFIPDAVLEHTYPPIIHSWQSHTADRLSQERQARKAPAVLILRWETGKTQTATQYSPLPQSTQAATPLHSRYGMLDPRPRYSTRAVTCTSNPEVNKQDLFIPDAVLEHTYPPIIHSWQSHTADRLSQERQARKAPAVLILRWETGKTQTATQYSPLPQSTQAATPLHSRYGLPVLDEWASKDPTDGQSGAGREPRR
ncbi:UNVERIFIED_CONTAM: hypothetical protein FKN15_026102 [Acipenser sinensis]